MMLPAMGPVTNPPIDARKYTHPVRIPISESGEIWTMRAAIKETYAPEKKPKATVNAMMAPSEVAGIQTARIMMLEMQHTMMNALNRPILSAVKPQVSLPPRLKPISMHHGWGYDSLALPCSVQYGNQIPRQTRAHPGGSCLHHQVRDGNEVTKVEEENANHDSHETELLEGLN
jgi:hypothetical protein